MPAMMNRCTNAGLRAHRVHITSVISIPAMKKQDMDVTEFAIEKSHRVISRMVPCAAILRVRCPPFGDRYANQNRHREANPYTKQIIPSMFFPVVMPLYI